MTKIGRNDLCPCGSGRKYKHCCLGKEEPLPLVGPGSELGPDLNLPESLDPRAQERGLRTVMKLAGREKFQSDEQYQAFLDYVWTAPSLPTVDEPQTPLERAQDKMYDAFGVVGDRRVKLAREALAISPDCADAYVLLAEESVGTPQDALPIYDQAIAAAERALGPDLRERYAGRFWTDLDTRPYLRALHGKADALSAVGRRDEAIAIAQDLLALNPLDDQGVSFFLINQLLLAGRDQEAAELMEEDPDDPSTSAAFNRALLKFRTLGDNLFARRALLAGRAANPLVIPYLLGDKKPPKKPPQDLDRLAEEFDAILYAETLRPAWQETPDAFEWIRRAVTEADNPPTDLAVPKTGPRFYLNPWDDVDIRHCPDCNARTRKHEPYLAIMVEPQWLLVSKLPGRACESCGLLTVNEWIVDQAVAAKLSETAPDDADNPNVVIGIIADELMRDRDEGPLDPTWAMEHVEAFREHFTPEDDWDYGTADDIGDESDLLGPVILLPPGRP